MEFLKLHDTKLKIMLDKIDLCRYGVTLESFDGNSDPGRAVIKRLLEEADERVGFSVKESVPYVEIFTSPSGAIEIFVRLLKKSSPRAKQTMLFSFDALEDLLACAAALTVADYREASSAYAAKGRYYLSLTLDAAEHPSLYDLVLEFGNREREETASDKREGTILTSEAVLRLGHVVRHD